MWLIDGDALIEKFNEKADMAECLVDARTAERFATFCALADAVEEMPTVDAEVVVRCKDCKNFKNYGKTSLLIDGKNIKAGWCYRRVRYDEEYRMPQDGFCSYGERKEDKAE